MKRGNKNTLAKISVIVSSAREHHSSGHTWVTHYRGRGMEVEGNPNTPIQFYYSTPPSAGLVYENVDQFFEHAELDKRKFRKAAALLVNPAISVWFDRFLVQSLVGFEAEMKNYLTDIEGL